LAWSLRSLFPKLWREGRRGVRWAREHARPTHIRQEDMAAVHAADDGGWHCVDVEKWGRERVCV